MQQKKYNIMKQIVILSGKGGTGKTVFTGALASLIDNKVMADCDVDAADLHLLLDPKIEKKEEFRSGSTARVNQELCCHCGKCVTACRFDAVSADHIIDPVSCEGCGYCSRVCPAGAIIMEENMCGHWFVSNTRFGPMVHARLGIAEENSGRLVSLVRKQAKELADKNNCDWVIVDGSPGIGCPVIACLSGIDCAIIVTEPTLSGAHDAKRVIKLADHFNIPVKLIINKHDLNPDMTDQIEDYCRQNDIELAGKISFDKSVVESMIEGKTVIEHPSSEAKQQIIAIWKKIENDLTAA